MRFNELIIDGKIIKSTSKINLILKDYGFNWLIDSEFESAKIEIKNNTIIWHDGKYYVGDWHYGIFKNGEFWGNFINGIFENGEFKGKWYSGINLQSNDIKNNNVQ
jgi:hypothetical protein